MLNYILVINMTKLPIAPIRRIIKNAGAQRVSADAEQALEKILVQMSGRHRQLAVAFAKHAGRKTVYTSDIEIALKTELNILIISFFLHLKLYE